MANLLDTVLKVLGVIIAVLVILAIVVLLLRSTQPMPQSSAEPQTTGQQALTNYFYDPYWDWLYYPYYWFYPNERHHHHYHHDNNKPHPPPPPTPSSAPPPPTPSSEPIPPPPSSESLPPLVPSLPDIPSTGDILPDSVINDSLSGGVNIPIIPIPESIQPLNPPQPPPVESSLPISPPPVESIQPISQIQPITESIQPISAEPIVQAFQNYSPESFQNTVPEPWSTVTSLPEVLPCPL